MFACSVSISQLSETAASKHDECHVTAVGHLVILCDYILYADVQCISEQLAPVLTAAPYHKIAPHRGMIVCQTVILQQ